MRIHEITSLKDKNKGVNRVGRGIGSHRGKTSGRGTKGQKARTGGQVPAYFEGGQKPITQIIPKRRGFHRPNKPHVLVLNLDDLARLAENGAVDLKILQSRGYLNGFDAVKVLGSGAPGGAIAVEVHSISASAREKIEQAGGKVTLIK